MKKIFLLCLLFISLKSFSQAVDTTTLVTNTNTTLANGGLITAATLRSLTLKYVRSFYDRANDSLMKSLTFARNTNRDSMIITYINTFGVSVRLAVKDSLPFDTTAMNNRIIATQDSITKHRVELDSIPTFIYKSFVLDFPNTSTLTSSAINQGWIGIDTTMAFGLIGVEPFVFLGTGMDENVFFTVRASANDFVNIVFHNNTAGSANPFSGTFRIYAIKK